MGLNLKSKVRLGILSLAVPALFLSVTPSSIAQGQGWDTYSVQGATVRFEMPKPIKMNQDPKTGMVLYVSKNSAKKTSMKVGIQKRNYKEDQAKGMSDEKVLENFALRVMAGSKLNFKKMGFKTNFQFGGNIKLKTGIGKQYNTQVGKAQVLNRFYINERGIYWVEAITQNTKDPAINRFLRSFTP